MESRVEKYHNVQAEIARLTNILISQHWMSSEGAQWEAVRIEARIRRERARSEMDNDWYSWVRDMNEMPQEQQEDLKLALEWF
jgi:hypothetical protein